MKRLHWFCFSYKGQDIESGRDADASVYLGFPDKNITMKRILDYKKDAGLMDNAVLVAVSYLGHMTKQVFEGETP